MRPSVHDKTFTNQNANEYRVSMPDNFFLNKKNFFQSTLTNNAYFRVMLAPFPVRELGGQYADMIAVLENERHRLHAFVHDKYQKGSVSFALRMIDRRLSRIDELLNGALSAIETLALLRPTDQASSFDALKMRADKYRDVRDRVDLAELQISATTDAMWQEHMLADYSEVAISESEPFFGEYKLIDGVNAALALYMRDFYGESTLRELEAKRAPWLPIALLGANISIEPRAGIAYVPRVEATRSRFWPLFLHELAHAKIASVLSRSDEPIWTQQWVGDNHKGQLRFASRFGKLKLAIDKFLTSLSTFFHGNSTNDVAFVSHTADCHAEEYLADACMLVLGGPAALLALHARLPTDCLTRLADARFHFRPTHPPNLFRVHFARHVLARLGFDDELAMFELNESFEEFLMASSSTSNVPSSIAGRASDVLRIVESSADDISNALIDASYNVVTAPFMTRETYRQSMDAISINSLTHHQLIARVWALRFKIAKEHCVDQHASGNALAIYKHRHLQSTFRSTVTSFQMKRDRLFASFK